MGYHLARRVRDTYLGERPGGTVPIAITAEYIAPPMLYSNRRCNSRGVRFERSAAATRVDRAGDTKAGIAEEKDAGSICSGEIFASRSALVIHKQQTSPKLYPRTPGRACCVTCPCSPPARLPRHLALFIYAVTPRLPSHPAPKFQHHIRVSPT